MNKSEVWVTFATAMVTKVGCPSVAAVTHIAESADALANEWDHRYGDGAFLLAGQTECAACHRPIDADSFVASVDGIKFCNDACLKGSGRDA